jgi:Sulfatase
MSSLGLVVLLIVSAAISPAMTTWANNVVEVPKIHRLVIVALCFLLLGLGLLWLFNHLFKDSRVAGFVSFTVLLGLSSGGRLVENLPTPWKWSVAVIVLSALVAIVLRLREWWLLDVIFVAAAAALVLPPLLSGGWSAVATDEPAPSITDFGPVPVMAERPDIVLVVLDGYASLPILRDFFDYEDADLVEDLGRDGFQVLGPAFTPYSMTHLAIPSLLDLDYATGDVTAATTADGRSMTRVLGGDSRLVHLLSENEYQIRMVEPGWHMSVCGEQVDSCVSDPFVDEAVDAVLSQSLFWSLLEPSVGSAFTNGARHAMTWTLENVGTIVDNDSPDLLFVHVLAPHPPLFLDPECEIVPESRRLSSSYAEVTGLDPEAAAARLHGYADQVRCVNGFIRQLAQTVAGSDAVVFVSGDHGSDAMSQLATAPEDWSEPQLLDRMSTFLAVKAPTECDIRSSLVTVAVLRMLVSCAGGLDLDPIDDRAFVVSRAEVDGRPAAMMRLDAGELTRFGACLASHDLSLECPR